MAAKKPKLEIIDNQDDEEQSETEAPEEEKAEPPEMVEMMFRGHVFKIPKEMDRWKTEACLAMNEGNYALTAKILLGTGQWALLQTLGDERRDIREFLTVFGAVADKECIA